jgi:DNA-directed RNA polymerase specialized sigma24 family protein
MDAHSSSSSGRMKNHQLLLFEECGEPGEWVVDNDATPPMATAPQQAPPDLALVVGNAVLSQLERIVGAVARRKLALFDQYPDIGFDDLFQEALLAVCKAMRSFDERRAQLSTFATLVAERRILDLHRRRSRDARRESIVISRAKLTHRADRTNP